jgi:asparagine synthase (glutamine-hydrolysing)
MCGIAGIFGPPSSRGDEALAAMLATMGHRGPDGRGMAGGDGCRIGLTRLAIVDLAAPAAPFVGEDGATVCAVNGEIDNARELRRELEAKGHRFATGVDTEVILHLWEEEGEGLVERLEGMFAFAVWDRHQGTLVLGRDRAGEKPLYFWRHGERLAFASELGALLAHPEVAARVEPRALLRYLVHGYVPAPLSPIAGVQKLPAGHLLVARGGEPTVWRYWDLAQHFAGPDVDDGRSAADLAAELEGELVAAVRRRSRSDVPFGVFLSGGIDSAALLSCLVEVHGPGVPAFTLGHDDPAFDESRDAVATARALGAEPHALVLSRPDLAAGLAAVGRDYDEPLGDASTIPTLLLARFARQRVKVVLSGEGADELFGGYPTYLGHRLAERLLRLPASLVGTGLAVAHRLLPPSMGNVAPDYLLQQFARGLDRPRLERHLAWFGCATPAEAAGLLAPGVLARLDPLELASPFALPRPSRRPPDSLAELLYTDFTTYLQDDLLTKIDRGTMLQSLESRAAFLDRRLMELAAGIPSRHKVRGLTTKAILRRAVRDRLPAAVLSRRKRGFNIPFSRWLLEGLGDELAARFSPERVAARGLFSWPAIDRLLAEHRERRADHRRPLYALLAFDLWCDRTFGAGAAVPLADAPEAVVSPSASWAP